MRSIIFTSTFLMLACILSCTNRESIPIQTINDFEDEKLDASVHTEKDVEVFKMKQSDGAFYTVIFYRFEKDELKGYKAYYGSDKNYQKAIYKWDSDSILSVDLISSDGQKESFKVKGKGNDAALIIDEN